MVGCTHGCQSIFSMLLSAGGRQTQYRASQLCEKQNEPFYVNWRLLAIAFLSLQSAVKHFNGGMGMDELWIRYLHLSDRSSSQVGTGVSNTRTELGTYCKNWCIPAPFLPFNTITGSTFQWQHGYGWAVGTLLVLVRSKFRSSGGRSQQH